ncbi:MAG: TonB-dependent receptor [Pseudomonadota bacterium]|nr:TonB-dependent receptor [Pseudomonadota bacterium]
MSSRSTTGVPPCSAFIALWMFSSMPLAQEAPPAELQEPTAQDAPFFAEPAETAASSDEATDPSAEPADADHDESRIPVVAESIPVVELKPAEADMAMTDPPRATQLEEIVVTATKRSQSLRDIPASISAFNGQDLESEGKMGLAEYLEETPGVTLNTLAPGLVRVSIRGISTDANPLGGIPSPTGILIGDTAFSDPYVSNVQPDLSAFDLATVEVLKGPQGTLFGGAALAGAIRYVLQDPMMGQWQLRAFSQYLDPEEGGEAFTSGVAVNVPLYEDHLALRVAYVNRNYPGVTDISRNPREEDVDEGSGEQYRGILSWQPTTSLGFKLTHLQQDYFTANAATTSDTRERRENDKRVQPQPVTNEFTMDSLEIGYDFETTKLTSTSSYITKDLLIFSDSTAGLYGPPPENFPSALFAFGTILDDSNAFAQEIRLQSTDGDGFQWLVGAYYYDFSVKFELITDLNAHQTLIGNGSLLDRLLGGLPVNLGNLYDETTLLYALSNTEATESAVFFDLSDTYWDKLELSAGARVYSTEVNGGFIGKGVVARASNNGENINFAANALKEDGISPKLSATYRFTDDVSTYALASRGFRFGGVQSIPSTPNNGVPAVYKSDTLWNYELGLRTNWFDNTLRFDITAFYIDYTNPQIQQATDAVLPLNFTSNVGAAVSSGFEASLRWLTPLPGLTMTLNGGLTDSHTIEPFEAADGTLVEAGSQMPGAAESQYSIALNWLSNPGVVTTGLNLDYSYVGKGYGDITHQHEINDFGTLNGNIVLGSDAWDLRPQLAVGVSNILDVTGVKGGTRANPIAGAAYDTFLLNTPRTYSVRVSLEF